MDALELEVRRQKKLPTRTLGTLLVAGKEFCFTLEDRVREPGVKVYGETAIPAGRYKITLETTPKRGPNTIYLHNVPGFTGILMHAGNTEADSLGCILLGEQVTLDGMIKGGTSKPAVAKLQAVLRAAIDSGLEVWVTVH